MLKAGEMLAGYRIVRLLGNGGMGEVYLADHPRLSRQDALKVLSAQLSDDEEFTERFRREADLAASLWHPHIVGVHDCGEFNGRLWLSMDFVDGTDAARLLADSPGGLAPSEVADIVDAIAAALDFAHHRGMLHRDVKPANILLTAGDDKRILLADFGIGREIAATNGLTATGMTIGTVTYAAPEQLMGEDLDGRTDQYALAATAYHLLSGQPVFAHSNPTIVISQHLNGTPARLGDARPEFAFFDPVLQQALAKDPAERYPSCVKFAAAIRLAATAAATGQTPAEAGPESAAGEVSSSAPTQHAAVSPDVGAAAATRVAQNLSEAGSAPAKSPALADTTKGEGLPRPAFAVVGAIAVALVAVAIALGVTLMRPTPDGQPSRAAQTSPSPTQTIPNVAAPATAAVALPGPPQPAPVAPPPSRPQSTFRYGAEVPT
jgi:serine/threonine-protein kinase